MKILLLEDDVRLASLIVRGLRREGHAVDNAGTVEDADWLARESVYDVLVLDVMLPDGDGFALCSGLRAKGNWTPVILLTARDAVADRVRGLDVGADDYLVKPFAFAELFARLRALARRGSVERPNVVRSGVRSSHTVDRLDVAFDDDRLVADAGSSCRPPWPITWGCASSSTATSISAPSPARRTSATSS